ncbi:cysteine-rich receptor-like protein kinase 25 isoform X1 [Vicia villosa]|uniref:cysteine-rich receptor-like protein kinase 25 isoform X1 n=1 Tax=Vicia villosa TaxID=3911 RepID=UPI00273B6F30|nr:cysteine-rich receptor-like protein kinase 25 isoform X1 [Vicia villosa]
MVSNTKLHIFFFLTLFIIFVSFATNSYADDPRFLYQVCSKYRFISNSTYQTNLHTLLSSLSSQATQNTQFFNNTVTSKNHSEPAYGLYKCRGDVPSSLCSSCVENATQSLSTNTECSFSVAAVIYYDECMVRYSNHSFFSTVTLAAGYVLASPTNMSNKESFNRLLYETLNKTADETSVKKFATREAKINIFQNLYCLAQCTPDIDERQCRSCLDGLINSDLPRCCAGAQGGQVVYPNCVIRFEIYPFYRSLTTPPTPAPVSSAKTAESKNGRSRTAIIVVIPIVVLAIVFATCFYCLKRKARKSRANILLQENFGQESTTLEGLQFDLAIIAAATNNFSHDNKIGKGGFGQVYKGTLRDGRDIAVKRLSTSSTQGSTEFKNEILLIAKLQHRNLVALIGFCLEEQEKILIYGYVPNGSLDYYLFGNQEQKLSWSERYKIIEGIALGVLYLHEYSRLKVIHRDLKPSNILLDERLSPKISDFGMARIVNIDQDRGITKRIVGTYGYMSPEYAMLGDFSEKSDVFSFGVMVIEIIIGKRNAESYESNHDGKGLLSYVWRQWHVETLLTTLDPYIKEKYSQIELIKCIQIGLLCVQENPNARPTMARVVSYLTNHSIKLPSPQEPAYLSYGMDQISVAQQGSSSGQSASSSKPYSVNNMSISISIPR